jgi:hypothetical protein
MGRYEGAAVRLAASLSWFAEQSSERYKIWPLPLAPRRQEAIENCAHHACVAAERRSYGLLRQPI